MYEIALEILKKLNNNHFDAYIVGGYPRDRYLGLQSFDIDICTNAKPDEIEKLFVVEKQFPFGVTIIKKENYLFEITTFRKDLDYQNHRYPGKIEFVDTLEEDLQRRDFIINTLCIDSNGNYIDILNAREDLSKKIIRTVGEADKKIKEDSLRIIRALKFAIKLNFELDIELIAAIQKYQDHIKKINPSRIEKELEGIDKNKIEKLIQKLNIKI